MPGAFASCGWERPRNGNGDLVPNAAVRNLIREDKIHQVYSAMQSGQDRFGMQTFNQSLAALLFSEADYARNPPCSVLLMPDELQDMINGGVVANQSGGKAPITQVVIKLRSPCW